MPVTMRSKLVALVVDLAHESRELLSHPAEHEERRVGAGLGKNLEQSLGIPAHAAFKAVPVVPFHEMVEA